VHVYVHQIHTLTAADAARDLFTAVEADYLPLVANLDVRLVGYWETSPVQGRTGECICIWEFDDYRHLERFTRALHGHDADGAAFRSWRAREARWIRRTDALICEPSTVCPTVADLQARGVRAAMCCHEVVACKPLRHIEYPERLAEMWANRFVQGEQPKNRETIGLYYAKWTNTVAINVWSIGSRLEDVTIWEPEWEKDPSFDLWNTLGREIRDDFYDRFLVPAPFSTVR
jgi:hypothetical protein